MNTAAAFLWALYIKRSFSKRGIFFQDDSEGEVGTVPRRGIKTVSKTRDRNRKSWRLY